eukprot:CAMPEP_0117461786 /NCGR_PEP_ID=MMETSP0784-20121206/2707_1 /TAXON_ID=39447 /ORGANISM="" /LENGTH=225 /DNA_ID=CAMNT_0005255509 /DNA_START=1 /DNA_END=678 /DNA_ORIENTATION=-
MLPPDLLALALNSLNFAMFLGGLLIKMPQIIAILRTRTVKGLSEASLTTEFLACLSLCVYNLLMGHPFKTWGEMALIGTQCAIQIGLFWALTTETVAVAPRLLGTATVAAAVVVLWFGFYPPQLLPIIGLMQTALGAIARVPQILLNFKQRHTGNQSIITWGLSLGGNVIRIITTLASVDDMVALAGYVVAAVLNLTLTLQILVYWQKTNEVIWGAKQEDAKKEK